MATARTTLGRLHVATVLQTFIDTEVLPGTGVKPATFWKGFNAIVADLAPKTPPCWSSATVCKPRSTPGKRPTPARSPI